MDGKVVIWDGTKTLGKDGVRKKKKIFEFVKK